MASQTVQANQGQERICPHCGISGFASLQSLSKHAGRCARSARLNPPERIKEARPTEPSRPATAASKEALATRPTPAVVVIGCPACESRIMSDGKALVKRSLRMAALERSEVELSNTKAEREKLREENKTLEAELEDSRKTPEQRLAERRDALEKEHAELCQRIEELGAEPERRGRRFFVLTPSEEEKVKDLEQECERLKQQLQELKDKHGQKKTETEKPEKKESDGFVIEV